MTDLLITNGTIYDGTGAEPFRAHLVIEGDRIADVIRDDEALPATPKNRIDATGKIVTPGFVDAHGHSDMNVLANPHAESKLRQGITTEVIGNCGSSAFPLRGAALQDEQESNESIGVTIDWTTAAGYIERLRAARPAINLVSFVGHSCIRGSVMGFEDRPPTDDEMAAMKREVEEAMDAGAVGVSTGLIYSPGMFSTPAEIIELQKVAAGRGGIYSSHVRGEGDTLLEAADEFFEVVEGAGCAGQFSHLKASGPGNWGKVARVIEKIEALNEKGLQVRFDKYPYIASSTSLSSLLPRWSRDCGRDATLERLADPELRRKMIDEAAEHNEGSDGWASVLVNQAGATEYERFQGHTVKEIAAVLGMDPGETFAELLVKSRLNTSICNFTMSQEETDAAILHPLGMLCTDAGARAPYGALSHDTPHPRAYGTFGKFFRDYVKERTLLTLEQAVAKATSLPCETFRLKDRGVLRKGAFADVLVIDWENFRDQAKFADPHHYCSGLDAIIVNGRLTVLHGNNTGERGGQFLAW